MEKQKKFRAEKARKALMTLRLEQCHQNWLTMMEYPANFEDSSFSLAAQKLSAKKAVHKKSGKQSYAE